MIAGHSKGEFTDVLIVWYYCCRRPALHAPVGNPRNETNSLRQWWKGCALQLSGTWRWGLSLPTAQHRTQTQTHTHTKGHPWLTHTQWAESWLFWQGCAKHSYIHTHSQTSHTHKGCGQCNQCQLILLRIEVTRPQSVIMTLPWHTLSGHKHTHTHRQYQQSLYFMVLFLVSVFAAAVLLWPRPC